MPDALRRLDQVRAVADPTRLRILEAVTGTPRTAKEVAALLGRKQTGVYHHLKVLQQAGLIREAGSRRKRGTIERSYAAVAADVRVDPRVFGGRRASGAAAVLTAVTRAVDQDLAGLSGSTGEMIGLRLTLEVAPGRLAELESVLRAWARRGRRTGARPCQVNLLAYPAGASAGG